MQTTVSVGAATALLTGSARTARAAGGDETWRFETDSMVYSSPTVADGTVYVGSWDGHVYALDAASGEEVWTFETGKRVRSSPTVADGTVYIGGWDASVYALDADVAGSSEGSRAQLGTLGHHESFTGDVDTNEGETTGPDGDDGDTDGIPGFGIGSGLAALGGTGYLLARWLPDDDSGP
ncbi:outer membrane protein assembly factor BamB family protein [Natrialbaceae archaeon A-gly3]